MDPLRNVISLVDAHEEAALGGKAVNLGLALRAGLPVPPGVALSVPLVAAIAAGDGPAIASLLGSPLPDGPLAVRSSAVGEDSQSASFAGQHATCLNVRRAGVPEAVRVVWESGRTPTAIAYRARHGIAGEPQIAVVVQQLLDPVAAGVLFTHDPVTGADELVIEAAWGLGESVVNGTVVPDRYRLEPTGRLLERVVGHKDVKMSRSADGGTVEEPVAEELRDAPTLGTSHVEQLYALVDRCRRVWGGGLDLEWALADDGVIYLLQCRPITTSI